MPRLFAELGVPMRSVSVARPSLDDVFMSYTGTTIRDAEATAQRRHASNGGASFGEEGTEHGVTGHRAPD